MSKTNDHGDPRRSEQNDLRDAVFAADDTGMVQSEADLATADLLEASEPLPTDGEEQDATLP